MSGFQTVRGMRDLLPDESRKFRFVTETAQAIATLYGFEEIVTPLLEASAVFERTLGETSDVVSKQTYTFQDRGGDSLTLRPEGTAGVARAFISEGLTQHLPLKLSYSGPMFRYERPQKGRYRQFFQFGVELLGVETAQADIEVIALGAQILKALKVDTVTELQLNTIGDQESRDAYRTALVAYLETRKSELSQDSLTRLEKNPLRILDSKDGGDQRVVKDGPLFSDYLNNTSREFFTRLRAGLDALEIKYTINPLLVRGLDYYCHTVFEFTTTALGAQNAVLAGGRYDGLIKLMGGPQTPGIGWACGVDRLALLVQNLPEMKRPVTIVPMGEEAQLKALTILQTLRQNGVPADMGFSGNMAKRMKRADKLRARAAVILGSNELERGVAQVKDLDSGEQKEILVSELLTYLQKLN